MNMRLAPPPNSIYSLHCSFLNQIHKIKTSLHPFPPSVLLPPAHTLCWHYMLRFPSKQEERKPRSLPPLRPPLPTRRQKMPRPQPRPNHGPYGSSLFTPYGPFFFHFSPDYRLALRSPAACGTEQAPGALAHEFTWWWRRQPHNFQWLQR